MLFREQQISINKATNNDIPNEFRIKKDDW